MAFLYEAVAKLPDITMEEAVRFKLLLAGAQRSPFFADGKLDAAKPIVNPAQLLGVSFSTDEHKVRLLLRLLQLLSFCITDGIQG